MKLLLASRGDVENPRNWSGTPYNLYNHFVKMPGVDVATLNWQLNRNLLRFYHMVLGKMMFIHGTARDPFLSVSAEGKIKKEFANLKTIPDFVLFISDYCVQKGISSKIKYAAYFDSFLGLQMQYVDNNRTGMNFFRRHYEAKNKESLERMTLIFTQNEWTRQCLLNEYNLPSAKVCNVGFGINATPFTGDKNYEDELLLIVLRKGTEKYKGLLLLLDAFKILKQKRPNVKLAVVGTELADKPQGVTYYYNQPRSVTLALFLKATLYVMPALSEPNGITYLEALANKTPIVGLNRFALPEFSGHGKWGFIVEHERSEELADVLDGALSDKAALKEMGETGQQFVMNRYKWDLVAAKMLDEMNKVLEERKTD